jgi:hypothetical protein
MPNPDTPNRPRSQQQRLKDFGRDVLWAFYNDGQVGDLDGAWLEEKAREHGLVYECEDGWRPIPHKPRTTR